VTAEEKLANIATFFDDDSEGQIYDNMSGAIIDLKRTGKADEIILGTLERVHAQLALINKILTE